MRFSFLVAAIVIPAAFAISPLRAQTEQIPAAVAPQNPAPSEEKIEVGQGVVCDTRQQIERFVALRSNGAEAEMALREVNDESHEQVCGVAKVMFSAGERIGGMAVQGRLLTILQISVHAFSNGPVWMKIPATVRFTVTAEKGQVV
jgi:hypothetical protein